MNLTHLVLVSSLTLPLAAMAKEELTLQQIPAKAAAAIQAAAGKETVKIESEKEDGADAYEAKWSAGGSKHKITVAADGTTIVQEDVIALDTAPAPVQAAINALSSSGKLSKVEKENGKKGLQYEAVFETATGKLEVMFDASGKELSRETKSKEKKKEDKKD